MTSKIILLVDRNAANLEIHWLTATAKIQPHLQKVLSRSSPVEVETLAIQDLTEQKAISLQSSLLYPLKLQIPPALDLSHLYQQCQDLVSLRQRLLRELAATPATYLLQFGWQGQDLCFDRLWPFPTQAAIASLGVQSPDLFTCHWRCLANLPILDLQIASSANYQTVVFK